jgi:putative peptide zinc metalloprotease protein
MQLGTAPALSALPPLRQELALHPGPDAADGSPCWNLHDPVDNRFFQLGWPAFEILSRWSLGRVADLLEAVGRDTTLRLQQQDVEGVFQFLAQHHLLAARGAADSERLARAAAATRLSKPMWLLKHYLFFRVPLVRPTPFLRALMPRLQCLYTPGFWWLMAVVALAGLYGVSLQWDSFVGTFSGYGGWQGVLGIGLALSVAKVAHELGHAFTAYRHGCRVPSMGVAFMVMVPMLYTDTNEAWKLPSRRARLQIGAAGMATELALAACATLLWLFLPDGPLRAGVFLLATSTWLLTLAVNLSPFMRFDGYFLLSDAINMPNLHERAFALGRWRLREALFGLGDPPPESFPPGRHRFLIAFAYATWLYRLALFLGIALLVYHLFFKALGLFLLAVELAWFIGWPIQREVKAWWAQRGRMRWNRPTRRSLLLLAALLLALCVPWPRGVEAPAVLQAQQAQWLYAPVPAQLREVAVKHGQAVQAGQALLSLDSAEWRHQLGLAQGREQQLRWQVQQQAFDGRLQGRGEALRQHWESVQAEVAGLLALGRQLQVSAGFDGRVVSLNPALQPGAWLARGERLLQIANPQGLRVEAYVGEAALPRIEPGMAARFIADEPGLARVGCEVESIDRIAVAALEHPSLASPHGGPIAATLDQAGRAMPHDAHFRVRLHRCEGLPGTARERLGAVTIGRVPHSLAGDWVRSFLAVVQREGGL